MPNRPDFSSDKRNSPDRPGNTCPIIDDAIDKLEEIRQANSDLRENGTYWYEKAAEYAEAYDELEKEKDEELSALQEELNDRDREIERLNSEIREMEEHQLLEPRNG